MQDVFKDIIIHLTDEHTFAADVPKAGGLYTSELKGIAPIMIKLKDDRRFFEGAVVTDRFIGKAAAMLLIDSGAKAIYGQVVSEHAVSVLEASGIIWEAETTVPYIINRKKDGMCPMEKAVLNETDASKAFEILKKRQNEMKYADIIEQGKTALGIELGSTRIKAVFTDEEAHILATGSFGWENKLENGLWTYSLEDIHQGLKACYKDLKAAVKEKYGVTLTKISKMGISAMMHGLMAFDAGGNLLVPFRTWRNTNTAKGAEYLTKLFNFNIPLRWSVAHLGTALLDNEPFVEKLDYMTTLAGYIHWLLTGEKVIGVGDASGMFPIDSAVADFDQKMIDAMEENMALPKPLRELFPKVLKAGEAAGILTEAGAKLLDEEGDLLAGSRLCPPEGDAGTGMTATQSVAIGTGNVSCGTSTFAMLVMDKPLSKVYPEIDVVTTPDGRDVAMVHVNNCTSEVNAWAGLFREFAALAGKELSEGEVFDIMYGQAEKAGSEGLLAYNFFSGEPICHIEEGRPMFVRMPDASLTVGGLAKVQLYSAFAGLKIGMDILNGENIAINRITGHGGMFKGNKLPAVVLSAAMGTPVYIREAAGEDGAFGQALLALYLDYASEMDLGTFLSEKIFGNVEFMCFDAPADEKAAFDKYVADLQAGMEAEKTAGGISF